MTCRRFGGNEAGGVATMVAAAGALLCVLAAIVVDLASLALAGRSLQGAADLAALSAAANLDRAHLAAETTARANLGEVATVTVTGRYSPDASRAPVDRFMASAAPANAARVTLTRASSLYFGRWIVGRSEVTLSRTAVAAASADPPRAMFSIGSRLAAVEGGIANALLSGLTGSSVNLSVMDYEALADAEVNLLGVFDALATELDVEAGRYDRLLEQEIEVGRALGVIRDLAGNQADSALSKLTGPASNVTVRLGEVFRLEADASGGLAQGLDASVSVLDLAMAMLETGGERQIRLDLGVQTGLADVTADLAIGERPNRSPWLTVTGQGQPVIRTAQARLYLKARTAQKLSGLAQIELPILLELAASEARLDAVSCGPDAVSVGVRPGLARAMLGRIDEAHLDDFQRTLTPTPATLLNVAGLVRLTAKGDVEVADTRFQTVRFSAADIADQRVRTATAANLPSGLIASLFDRLEVNVQALGLGLGLGGLTSALGSLLAPIGPVLDGLVHPILDMVGLKLGQADVRVHGVTCGGAERPPVLVG
ncbi:hypothetical protein IP78_01875 [Brevundimonas sp. AAP58]|uniref:TadG family pilus assembly protein n=1 Tax=Brevundimonas sp. AAP58 TaxID=1523422 RepID=UPI0006B9EF49|nr:TadG family pilus assembly protein [Brevundimonas sp. AAP58]KPF83505.1 hypothetical protein IP78_01875 [Brevundimonas sp. AAP58]